MTESHTSVSLVGKFGLSFSSDDMPHFQFEVLGRTSSGNYLLQFYSWAMGDPTDQQLVAEDWFVANRVKFYTDADEWRLHGEIRLSRPVA